MNIKHFAKAVLSLTTMFLGFQFGRDIATKISTMTTSATPAS
jgi:hypothetical protein